MLSQKRNKGQFPRKDISGLIGTRHGLLVILERAKGKDPNLTVKCQCDCGNTTLTRLAGVMSGKTTSCGCIKKQRYKEFWERRAARLSKAACRVIFHACRKVLNVSEPVAASMKMPKPLVDFARRLHVERLRTALIITGFRSGGYLKAYLTRRISRDEYWICRWYARHRPPVSPAGPPLVITDADLDCVDGQQWCAA